MAGVKLIVIYPTPTDITAFEKVYVEDHIPMALEQLKGPKKIVASKVLGSPQGSAPFYRLAEVYFDSMEDLEKCAGSEGAQATLGHASTISSGGEPILLIADEETATF
jgi:uncharacterized protein (TIGR02118 family)